MHSRNLHEQTTEILSSEIKNHLKTGGRRGVRFEHRSTNTTSALRSKDKKNYHCIDISCLSHIIEVRSQQGLIVVEPNVSMDALVEATLHYGVIPPVVMEFPGITVGGGIQGGALESSSFKWGQFNDTAREYEIITGQGEVITANPSSYEDLFYGCSGSYGSLGLLTLVTLQVIPAKRFVHLNYYRTSDKRDIAQRIQEEVESSENDFVEGIVFNRTHSVVITGVFADSGLPLPVQTFIKAGDPWFWRHAQEKSQKHDHYQELVPLYDYLFRYDRGAFWMGENVFSKLHIPSNKLTRLILNPFLKTRELYKSLHAFGATQDYFIQDAYFPFHQAVDCLEYNEKNLGIYPIWLCPVKPTTTPQKLSPHCSDAPLLVDIGIWGKPQHIREKYFEINRTFEAFLKARGARKMFYAETFYTEEEFWNVYDRGWYTALREKYRADRIFPDLWEKIHVAEKYKQKILTGCLKILREAAIEKIAKFL